MSKPDPTRTPPAWSLTTEARYEKIIEAFGGDGYYITKAAELGPILKEAMENPKPCIVNIMIHPRAQRKPQKFNWLTR